MKVKVSAGLATVASLFALWIAAGGQLTPPPTPTPTPTPTPVPGACLAASNCYPKPPGTAGDGVVGIPTGTVLVPCGSTATISANNTVIDSCIYTGYLNIKGTNVTIRNSRIMGAIQNTDAGTFTIEDSEIGPDSGCNSDVALLRWANYTARRNYMHGNGDGMRFAGDNIIAQDNFIATCDLPGDHSDGIQGNFSGVNNTVDHNTIDLRGSTNGPNAAVFFADNSVSATITNNLLLAGPSVALKVHDDHTPDIGPWIVTGNRLNGSTRTTNTECAAATMIWSGNYQVTVNSDYTIATTGSLVNC